MEKVKSLNRYQKGILILMAVMAIAFGAVYFMTISRVGFLYNDTILVPTLEDGNTVYTGKIRGQQAQFTVSADKTVVFRYGDKTFGPYMAKEDPTAIPKDIKIAENMVGVELLQGDSILFRGGVWDHGDGYLLYNEDGTAYDIGVSYVDGNGIERGENGNEIDFAEPSASAILHLMSDPESTHKGEWFVWFGAVCICVLNALLILFADELFRLQLRFRIRNADDAEPSDWEIAGRYIGWTALAGSALMLFIAGLQ